jgi:hypothetical protein
MLVSKMPLYHIWRGSKSLGHVRVTITGEMVKLLVNCRYAHHQGERQHPYPSIILCANEDRPEIVSDTDWNANYVLGELSPGLIKELHRLKAKLQELKCDGLRTFVIPKESEASVPKQNVITVTPFMLFGYLRNDRRYVTVSEKMADALTDAKYPDFLYDRRPSKKGKSLCVRLTESYRLFDWEDSGEEHCKEVKPSDLLQDELDRYYELMRRLNNLGFRSTSASREVRAVAKEQSFTEALYNDRKAAAVKAAQPAIAKDLAVNTIVDVCTDSDRKMLQQRDTLFTALPARCSNLLRDIDSLNRRYGWPDEDVKIAAVELQQACRKFEKLFGKKYQKLKGKA